MLKITKTIMFVYFYYVLYTISVFGKPLSNNNVRNIAEIRIFSNNSVLQLWLTISAEKRYLEISWINAHAKSSDLILLTKKEPTKFRKSYLDPYIALANINESEGSAYIPIDGYTTPSYGDFFFQNKSLLGVGSPYSFERQRKTSSAYWISENGPEDIVASIKPGLSSEWFTTGIPFDYNLSRNVTSNTSCYGYWASYINNNGNILASSCIRAYPRWMSQLSHVIRYLRLRDLFIPGTHDSGSVRPNFDPMLKETLLTKYALTQDDDIKGQLMHGARYLDLRIGYYKRLPEKFYINHGITRHISLKMAIDQIKDFVRDTDEIIILGFKEFPVGFGKNLNVHRLLVHYLIEQFGKSIVDPSVTWSGNLYNIWTRKQNVIIAYDEESVVNEFPQFLFTSVQQRWGNMQTWEGLERYLCEVNERDISRFSSRPVSDMAELTPDTWDVIKDTMGGLRKMADQINWRISQLYRERLAWRANIVAVDFIRGTNLMDLAIALNSKKTY